MIDDIVDLGSICPYCRIDLGEKPTRKKKCPKCGDVIQVRKEKLLTQSQVDRIDKEVGLFYLLQKFGIARERYEKNKGRLFIVSPEEIDPEKIVWGIASEIARESEAKRDWQVLKMHYYSMAIYAHQKGWDYLDLRRKSALADLYYYQSLNIKRVSITGSYDSCSSCRALDGKIFSVKEALIKMPLPNSLCSHERWAGFCRCIYQPIMD